MKVVKLVPAFTDGRGSITDILNGVDVRHIGVIKSKANTVRGNHYHLKADQYTYVLSGKIEYWEGKEEQKKTSVILTKGEFVVSTASYAHAIRFLEDSELLVLTTQSRSEDGYEQDTIRLKEPLCS